MSSGSREGEGKVVCVTGASGYIASWLLKLLLHRGYTVRATVRNLSDPKKTEHLLNGEVISQQHLKALEGSNERLELMEAELDEEGSFDSVIDGCHGLFHLASPVLLTSSNPQADIVDVAVKGTLNVLKSCCKTTSIRRVVLTSSTGAVVYNERPFGPDVVVDETWLSDHAFCKTNELWYCLSKTMAEEAAWDFAKHNGIDLVVMNPGFVIGPLLQPTLNLTSQFLLQILKGQPLFPYYQIVDVRDAANAHVMAFENSLANGRYLIVGHSINHFDLMQLFHKLYPSIVDAPISGVGDDPVGEVSKQKIESLGVKFMDLEESLKDTVESFKQKNFLNF